MFDGSKSIETPRTLSASIEIAYEGCGYGKTMQWHAKAVEVADKLNEKCEHLDKDNVLIVMAPIEEGLSTRIKFKVKCGKCDAKYERTSEKLTLKFLKFYGLLA